MLALLLDDPISYRSISRALGHPVIPLFAVALVLFACNQPADDISAWPRMAIHWSFLVLLAACVVREHHVLEPVLRSWPMVRIGVVSYSIYLCHLLVRHGVDKGIQLGGWSSPLILFLGTMLVSWIAAEISYWAFESRFLALKRRWI
jgi:peptidoglycan/LPS O-acetylase OafA/YrhL